MRKYLFNLSNNFNVIRWSIFFVVVSFVAVVGVYKYIDLSDSVALTFSSLEITYLLITDSISISYIFLPLYLFIICGISSTSELGFLEIIKYKNRNSWYIFKFFTMFSYTIMFFLGIFFINFAISYNAFPFISVWSSDFVTMQVSLGQNVSNFANLPTITLGISMISSFIMYLFIGAIALLVSIITESEVTALILSLSIGIGSSFLSIYIFFVQNSVENKLKQSLLFLIFLVIVVSISMIVANKKDFKVFKKV